MNVSEEKREEGIIRNAGVLDLKMLRKRKLNALGG
jgi:hypothetical protein